MSLNRLVILSAAKNLFVLSLRGLQNRPWQSHSPKDVRSLRFARNDHYQSDYDVTLCERGEDTSCILRTFAEGLDGRHRLW
jgi:hypothetical protein